jgi:hypothetical protein
MKSAEAQATRHTSKSPIENVYVRLQEAGFDRAFVRQYVLPSWWDDELSHNPAMRTMAEIAIARLLGISIESLRTPEAPLTPVLDKFCLTQTTQKAQLPAIALAQSVARLLTSAFLELPSFRSGGNINDVWQEILRNHRSVDLNGLLEWSWTNGIVVAHLGQLPKGAKKFAGIAMCYDERPVIILASDLDSPSWLAFHLAHELDHILEGHVQSGNMVIDDEISWNPTVDKLPSPLNSLEHIGIHQGGHQLIAKMLQQHLPDELPESVTSVLPLIGIQSDE